MHPLYLLALGCLAFCNPPGLSGWVESLPPAQEGHAFPAPQGTGPGLWRTHSAPAPGEQRRGCGPQPTQGHVLRMCQEPRVPDTLKGVCEVKAALVTAQRRDRPSFHSLTREQCVTSQQTGCRSGHGLPLGLTFNRFAKNAKPGRSLYWSFFFLIIIIIHKHIYVNMK